ncbi:MAG: DipZ protein, partial [Actinobacteria bacterium]|nr:DipZ protein [Actinomycetota bacterium]
MRAPVDTLSAPMIPPKLAWVNVASLRMDKQLG